MKGFIVISAVFMVVIAEPPISKSYLPPPPGKTGFSQAPSFQPQVIAARTLDQGHGLSRNGNDHATAKFSNNGPGYDSAVLARQAFEATSEPANYNFGYMVNDFNEGTDFGHHEERLEETARGAYHVVLPDGRKQTVSYKADERGFKPQISYEESEDLSRGYDANANNRNQENGHHDNGVQARNGHHEFGNHDNGFHGSNGHHENGFGNHGNGFNGGHGNHGSARSGY